MEIIFKTLPETVEAFKALPEYGFKSPFQVAALFVAAVCAYPKSPDACYAMVDALRGPQPMNQREKDFIRDRMRSKADYIGHAYFSGATPANNYQPNTPYTVVVEENAHSYDAEGYVTVYLKTAGADSPRPVQLRKKGEEWFLWEHSGPLADIRTPAAKDPWA
jgi:hypothetical protein